MGLIRVVVVSTMSFGLKAALLLDLEGFFVFVLVAMVAMATVKGRQCGIKGG